MYDYKKEIKEDIVQYLRNDWTLIDEGDDVLVAERNGDRYVLEEDDCWDNQNFCDYLEEELWADDDVTGNGSGSYWFNSLKAEECLVGNLHLLAEACEAFGSDFDVLKDGAKACDVTIRCYLLSQVLYDAIDEWVQEQIRENSLEME